MKTQSISIKNNGKELNHLAWGVKRRHNLTWKQAMNHAFRALRMKNELSTGIVTFSFTKLDGSNRDAVATRNLEVIPSEFHPKGTSTKPETTNVVSFFDLTAKGWRSFDISNLNPSLV